MHFNKEPYIFVIGNEKGGAGKTTCSMHLIISLLEMGYKVASIDIDSRQHSLTTYIAAVTLTIKLICQYIFI
jgi:chromosome partitioning protein